MTGETVGSVYSTEEEVTDQFIDWILISVLRPRKLFGVQLSESVFMYNLQNHSPE